MDADLQHDESKILEMIKIQKNDNLDIVVGSRFLERNYTSALSKKRNIVHANWLANKISRKAK